uniref:Uncharacterized protein LOC111115242 n=1 Tax=Crassostrea virginica TaxID=6565 RepID=A0A8B8C3S4_CRAVI|nr:uncharacterized protein LOC111115242 [Crassostrea virginica]
MAARVLVLALTAFCVDAFIYDTLNQNGRYNSFNTHEPCNHIKDLIHEWALHNRMDAVKHIYEYLVTHDKTHQGHTDQVGRRSAKRYTYSSNFDEAFDQHNTHPDENRIKTLIQHNNEADCVDRLQTYCEDLLHIQHHSAHSTTHKPQDKPTTVPVTTAPPTTKKPVVTTTVPPTTTAMPPTTTATDATTTATDVTTTTLAPLNLKTCDALAFVMALASGNQVLDQNAGLCSDGTHTESEAILLQTCKAPAPSTWTPGPKVMENCAQIPAYTPIATFEFGQYNLDSSSLSGIFVECTDDGFKIAAQLCGHGPEIYTLHKGASTLRQNADNYYVVLI